MNFSEFIFCIFKLYTLNANIYDLYVKCSSYVNNKDVKCSKYVNKDDT